MTAMSLAPELQLPWESTGAEDSRFRRILCNLLALFVALAILVPLLPVRELSREKSEAIPPALARVIVEKKVLPEPVPVPVQPSSKPEPEPKPRPVEKKPLEQPEPPVAAKVEPPPKPQDKLEKAREVAAVAGMLAFQDELAQMRDSLDLDAMPQARMSRGEATAAQLERAVITGGAAADSGGINTSTLSRDTGGPALSGRETTLVQSTIASTGQKSMASASARLGGRSDESIRQVMDRNKGAIFAIYNRALRQDPLLEGKLVFEMVIEASGEVVQIKLLSSELVDDELTRKILSRIRMIRFEAQDVISTRVNYSFDFLPYS
jgi:outer membrane biosynthesis protein TonB